MGEQICVVTGATSGIGKEIARGLVKRGAKLAIVCRNPAKGEATVAELTSSAPGAEISVFVADLSVLADVRRVAAELHDAYPRLDVLVNNAGIHSSASATSTDGFDEMIATNHLGPFLLTNLLLDLLEQAAPSRIVVVASEAHRNAGRLDPSTFASPGRYGAMKAFRVYGRSKLLNILFTQELAVRLEGTGITANAMCPGLVATGLLRELPGVATAAANAASRTPFLRRPDQGARMAIRLALDPEFEGRSGGFYSSTPGAGLLPAARSRHDTAAQRAIWIRSEHLVGLT